MINLLDPFWSYFYGFISADGTLEESSRKRGKLKIELNHRDIDILQLFHETLPINSSLSSRSRITNFSKGKEILTITLAIYDLSFREEIKEYGFPVGKKDIVIGMPGSDYLPIDYFRGYVDGNGSLGMTANGFPFISITTNSDEIKDAYLELIKSITGDVKHPNRNKRDNIYNIVLYKESCQKFVKSLYYPNCIALNRKLNMCQEVNNWVRPPEMKKRFK